MSEHLPALALLAMLFMQSEVLLELAVLATGPRLKGPCPRGLKLTYLLGRMVVANVTELTGMFYNAILCRP